MSFFKQKNVKSVGIINKTALLLLLTGILVSSPGCQLIRSVTQPERRDKVNENIEKNEGKDEREDEREEKNYEKAKAELKQKHYERQAERTRKRMDYNAEKAEVWRENHTKSNINHIFKEIGEWFEWFFGLFKTRDKGLFNH
ncbi:MAG: hypothetical protein ACOCTM_00835 [Bacteroidota bacterium]